MNINNRQQLLTFVALAVIAIWAGDKLIFSPLTKLWKERSTRIAELRKSVSQGSLFLEREPSIRRRWESMETNTLPAQSSMAENMVLKAFERWSQASRISITSIKPQWKQNDEDFTTLECRAEAFGSIQAVTRFLYEVEKDPLALKVEVVEISSRDNDGQQLALGLQVSGLLLSPPEQ